MAWTMRACSLLECVMALAISACGIGDGDDRPRAQAARKPALATAAAMPETEVATVPPAVAPSPPRSLRAVAADLSGSGEPMLLVAGWARWNGDENRLWVTDSDDDGRHELVIGLRQRRASRAFSLEGGALVAREPNGTGPQRKGDAVVMNLPGGGSPLSVAVRAASGGRPVLATIEEWNAELARLRPR